MKRMKVLFGNRRMMVLLTLAILVLAAAALIASSASFTATSANPATCSLPGTLSIHQRQDTSSGTSDLMMPGDLPDRHGHRSANAGDGAADFRYLQRQASRTPLTRSTPATTPSSV